MSLESLPLILVATPGITFLGLSIVWLLGGHLPELFVSRLTKGVYAFLTLLAAVIFWRMWQDDLHAVRVSLGDHWFKVAHYEFRPPVAADRHHHGDSGGDRGQLQRELFAS